MFLYMKRYCLHIIFLWASLGSLGLVHAQTNAEKRIEIVSVSSSERIQYGIDRLKTTLLNNGYRVNIVAQASRIPGKRQIIVQLSDTVHLKKEGFSLLTDKEGNVSVLAADPSGALYGCLELAERIQVDKQLPAKFAVTDEPEMVLRGTCIGVQKPDYLPGRDVYEYPYTPETFPWFYDRQLWIRFLDSMVNNRLNSLYLWNGHPFASLVRLKDYPYAVEVDSATFAKNEEIYRFLTHEADKRGIWVIQMFYNIIVSKPFAAHHHIKTQDRNRPIIPLIADYTRKSIAAFVEKYPNVGLMVCLGEAMEGVGNDDIEWFTKTIIPGVKDGLRALGKTDEPPIVLRAHDTDAPAVVKASRSLYQNLYTEAKFNGEALTTYEPRGAWAELHRTLSRSGSVQIENVHILANLEPFRYGAVDFIQKCVKGMHAIYESNGLHLYPQASYWDWPYTADKVSPRLLQIDRDWIWYRSWSRYAWKSNRDSAQEATYWSGLLAGKFGCSTENGRHILEAYNQMGLIAPKLLRRFGITDGNRQTMTLGMLMTQLINPYRYGLFELLYESESPDGEKLIDYAEKEWNHQPHHGETPVQIIREVTDHGGNAVRAIEKAAITVTKNKEEFKRIQNDAYIYQALAAHYALKAQAALQVLRYKYSNNIADLDKAVLLLEKSVVFYKQLVALTKDTYLYANSMQTKQRKIPLRGVDGTYKTWSEVLVPFEQELQHFKHKIDSLKHHAADNPVRYSPMTNATVTLASTGNYRVDSGSIAFSDTSLPVTAVAAELKGLQGVKYAFRQQVKQGTTLSFVNKEPVKVLVGFFSKKDASFAKAPELETDASANNYGQSEIKIANAVLLKGMPPVNVHTYTFKPGNNTLSIPKGACLVLGFINDSETMHVYDAGFTEKGSKRDIDWLFE